jgi:hypothetical protein
MFGPERTATGRPRTRFESRSPVSGSSPFVRLSDLREGTARDGEHDHVRVGGRCFIDRRRLDPAQVRARQIARVATRLVDRSHLVRVAARERDLVSPFTQQTGERRSPRTTADDNDFHERVTKSIVTGTPSSSNWSRI